MTLFLKKIFLSAAQPTDQGEESVLILFVVVIVGRGTIFDLPIYSFFGGGEKEKLCLRGVKKAKNFPKRGVKRQKLFQKRCEKTKTLLQKGCEKAKTFSKGVCTSWCIDLSKILYSTPRISERIPFLFSSGNEDIVRIYL